MRNDVANMLYALFFVIVSLFTWCSISFKIADYIWGEETLFSRRKNAILIYLISIFIALIMTGIVYCLILFIQSL